MKGENRKHLLTVRDTGGGPINDDTLRPAAAAVETGADIDPLSAVYTAPLYTVLFCTVLYCMLYIHTTPVVLVHSTTQHRPASTRSVHQWCQTPMVWSPSQYVGNVHWPIFTRRMSYKYDGILWALQ